MKEKEVSVVLNLYKRPYGLNTQINSILNQSYSIKEENIHIWKNTPESGDDYDLKSFVKINFPKIKIYECNYNTKYFGRFTIPLLLKTEYIAVFDDDIIPGKKWIENCVNSIQKEKGIFGASGVFLKENSYHPNYKVGWNGIKKNEITQVDLVGHCWFFEKRFSKFMWDQEPPSWENGEDMFFSFVAQSQGVNTYVPPYDENDVETWGNVPGRDMNMSEDSSASWLHNKNHAKQRDDIVKELTKKGWDIITWKK